jgi:hypothetical protein
MSEQDQETRLERAGFTANRTAQELREVRERFPIRDELARRLHAFEEEARTLAGLIAMELRDREAFGGAA